MRSPAIASPGRLRVALWDEPMLIIDPPQRLMSACIMALGEHGLSAFGLPGGVWHTHMNCGLRNAGRCRAVYAIFERAQVTTGDRATMPEVSRFYGIVITMYFDEHNPPHFHAQYATTRLSSPSILSG
jgi:hypothetical protein